MKQNLFTLLFCLGGATGASADVLPLIPEPKQMVTTAGAPLRMPSKVSVAGALPPDTLSALRPLADGLGMTLLGAPDAAHATCVLLPATPSDSVPPSGYRLRVTPRGVRLSAHTVEGWRYGLATLWQLAACGEVRPVDIHDYPGLEWRGIMLDVSRHFVSMDFLRKQVDVLARYKFNRFHLHLTDAAGWRIEIKRYPRLTQFAAWRPNALWKDWWNKGRLYSEEGSDSAYGGYYTQQELRALVRYAADRGITIVPEIEMPGHSEEVLTAYPALSCTHEPYKQADFCAGNDSTFVFLENVLSEVMDIFPSPYIHIGGDEAAKASWPTCPRCQARMEREGLADVEELQGYFVRRIGSFLRAHGRHLLGWDEILSDSLPADAAVMVWRDTAWVDDAVAQGKRVVLSPGAFFYLDAYQDAPFTQPEANGGYRPLDQVYNFDAEPMFAGCPDMLMGIQGNLWCEWIPTEADVERMLYPRALAVAEQAWTTEPSRYASRTSPRKDYAAFRRRALVQNERLRTEGVRAFDLKNEVGHRPEVAQPVNHLAKGCTVTYNAPFSPYYPAAREATLTDGQRGDWSYSDGRWQGFIAGPRLDVTVDLGSVKDFGSVEADFFDAPGAEIFWPAEVRVSVSADGQTFTPLGTAQATADNIERSPIRTWSWTGKTQGRYVRVQAPAGEKKGWIFTDEIVVR